MEGVTLSRSNDWSAVDRAIAILWFAGPVGAFIQNIAAYTILDDYVFSPLSLLGRLFTHSYPR